MNRNLLKQIWNERRSNAFLWMELFVVFVILWYIVDVVYVTLSIYNLPMGFDIENTYVLRFERMTSKSISCGDFCADAVRKPAANNRTDRLNFLYIILL